MKHGQKGFKVIEYLVELREIIKDESPAFIFNDRGSDLWIRACNLAPDF